MRAWLLLPLLFALPWPPAEGATERNIRGWTVHLDEPLNREEALRDQVLRLLDQKLWEVENWVPGAAVARLKEVSLWLRLDEPSAPGGVYHPSSIWLREHGRPPEMARGIEFGNARNFLSWSRQQPSMVLHEMAHAWHHQVLGYGHEGIAAAHSRAKEGGGYQSILHVMGKKEPAYALKNDKEFFAELSEAWWGTNDFFPFVRAEILEFDPETAKALERAWAFVPEDPKAQ